MAANIDQFGNIITADIRQDSDGTWSRNVWCGSGCVTNVQRRHGYRTRKSATEGDISESASETNRHSN